MNTRQLEQFTIVDSCRYSVSDRTSNAFYCRNIQKDKFKQVHCSKRFFIEFFKDRLSFHISRICQMLNLPDFDKIPAISALATMHAVLTKTSIARHCSTTDYRRQLHCTAPGGRRHSVTHSSHSAILLEQNPIAVGLCVCECECVCV